MSLNVLAIVTISAVFFGVAALAAAGLAWARSRRTSLAEARLDAMTKSITIYARDDLGHVAGSNSYVADDWGQPAEWERWIGGFLDVRALIRQAGVRVTPWQLLGLTAGAASGGALLGSLSRAALWTGPLATIGAAAAPLLWLLWKRQQRFVKFESQMPDALDLLARSLRAGHSMADGLRLISEEMADPIAGEFRRCYQQQALGVALESTLEELTVRVPNPDLRFFVNAVILQRQTGGDTAEILDKIATLVRQRFQIRAQVRALTGEGRLSGMVLLALPIVLAIYLYFRNPDYLLLLFSDPLGQKMVIAAIVLQILGGVVIKRIVDIKI